MLCQHWFSESNLLLPVGTGGCRAAAGREVFQGHGCAIEWNIFEAAGGGESSFSPSVLGGTFP